VFDVGLLVKIRDVHKLPHDSVIAVLFGQDENEEVIAGKTPDLITQDDSKKFAFEIGTSRGVSQNTLDIYFLEKWRKYLFLLERKLVDGLGIYTVNRFSVIHNCGIIGHDVDIILAVFNHFSSLVEQIANTLNIETYELYQEAHHTRELLKNLEYPIIEDSNEDGLFIDPEFMHRLEDLKPSLCVDADIDPVILKPFHGHPDDWLNSCEGTKCARDIIVHQPMLKLERAKEYRSCVNYGRLLNKADDFPTSSQPRHLMSWAEMTEDQSEMVD
jgi:hypothetical protein